MPETPQFNPEDYTHEKGDITYNNPETETQQIQDELRTTNEKENSNLGPTLEEIEEAYRFNELIEEKQVTPEYLDRFLKKEQTSKEVEQLFKKIFEKIKDIKEPGTFDHGLSISKGKELNNTIGDIITNGFKSSNQLNYIPLNFPDHISFTFVSDGFPEKDGYPVIFELDEEFLGYALISEMRRVIEGQQSSKPIISFVGKMGKMGNERRFNYLVKNDLLNTLKRKGLFQYVKKTFEELSTTSYKYSNDKQMLDNEFDNLFEQIYMPLDTPYHNPKFEAPPYITELIVSPEIVREYQQTTKKSTVDAILLKDLDESTIESLKNHLNHLAVNNLEYATPIYNHEGDVIWPLQMKHELVKELVFKRKSNNP